MAKCKFCNLEGLNWAQDGNGRWKLLQGSKQHNCKNKPDEKYVKPNWVVFNCKKCNCETRQNTNLIESSVICIDCISLI